MNFRLVITKIESVNPIYCRHFKTAKKAAKWLKRMKIDYSQYNAYII